MQSEIFAPFYDLPEVKNVCSILARSLKKKLAQSYKNQLPEKTLYKGEGDGSACAIVNLL